MGGGDACVVLFGPNLFKPVVAQPAGDHLNRNTPFGRKLFGRESYGMEWCAVLLSQLSHKPLIGIRLGIAQTEIHVGNGKREVSETE